MGDRKRNRASVKGGGAIGDGARGTQKPGGLKEAVDDDGRKSGGDCRRRGPSESDSNRWWPPAYRTRSAREADRRRTGNPV